MPIKILEESVTNLAEYSAVSIAFEVTSYFRLEPIHRGLGGIQLIEQAVSPPYVKDYDQAKGEGPTRWLKRWDLTNWGVFSAFASSQRVGGAVVAWRTPELDMLNGRDDLAALWDLRVRPEYRGRGIGARLFAAAIAWVQDRSCIALKVETQNINVPACRFYERQGCRLQAINPYAYPLHLEEVQLIWQKDL